MKDFKIAFITKLAKTNRIRIQISYEIPISNWKTE